MEVKQIYELVNGITNEVLGKSDLLNENLENIVDVGNEVLNTNNVDNYVKTLVNQIGKIVFVNRPYAGKFPSVLMDSWEFGSVLQKVTADLPNAVENESWELEDGEEYNPNIFYKPSVSAKFYNSKVTFEIPVSITERQVKESFQNSTQLNAFLSMIYDAVDKAMTIKLDALVMRTINNMIDLTFSNEDETEQRAINLLERYNTQFNKELLAKDALTDLEFIKYASYIIGLYSDRIGTISTLFNIGGKERFTSKENLHLILLSEFASSVDAYMLSEVRHNQLVSLPNHETVPYWQGSGTNYAFADTSTIKVKHKVDNDLVDVNYSGILAVMFDRNALGISNLNKRVTTNYNAKAEFFNNYYKFDAGYFNDTNENFIVFYIADETPENVILNNTLNDNTLVVEPTTITTKSINKFTLTAKEGYEFKKDDIPTLTIVTKNGNNVYYEFKFDSDELDVSDICTLVIDFSTTNINTDSSENGIRYCSSYEKEDVNENGTD